MMKNENSTPTGVEEARRKLEMVSGKRFWRSLDEWAETEEFKQAVHRHFPSRMDEVIDPVTRRTFLKVMGASLAFAGLAGCSPVQPQEKIFPYTGQQPEYLVPGRALYFATAMPMGGYGTGLLVESHMGRPTKVEGNPAHPASLGAAGIWEQASILSVYDPDRSQTVLLNGRISSWDNFLRAIQDERTRHRQNGGAGLRFLTGPITSPTVAAQMRQLLSADHFPNARWHRWEPVNNTASRTALGPVDLVYNLEAADVVLTLDSNFLLEGPAHLALARQYARRKKVSGGQTEIVRHYAVESSPTLTGANADHRLRLRPSQIEAAARAIAGGAGVAAAPGTGLPAEAQRFIAAVVADLQAKRGRSVVIPGPYASPAVHAIAYSLNEALGNVGTTVTSRPPVEVEPVDQLASIRELAADIDAGRVDTVVMLDVNPVYNAPADLGFYDLLVNKVRLRVHLGEYHDETAFVSNWHVPQAHYLEAWGDVLAFDGTVTIMQPLIAPLYGGKTAPELIAGLLGQGNRTGYDIVREYWQTQTAGGATAAVAGQQTVVGGVNAGAVANPVFEDFWVRSLNDGIAAPTARAGQPAQQPVGAPAGAAGAAPPQPQQPPAAGSPAVPPPGATAQERQQAPAVVAAPPAPAQPAPQAAAVQLNQALLAQAPPASSAKYEVAFRPDPSLWDGTFANNGWLQELPKPLTKLTWDNAAIMSVRTAEELGVKDGDVVSLTVAGRTVNAPVRILPGHPNGLVTAHLGMGRDRAGRVGDKVGFNAYLLRTVEGLWSAPVEIAATGDFVELAFTDKHNIIYEGEWEPNREERQKEAGSIERDYRGDNEYVGQSQGWVDGQQGRDLLKVASIREFLANPEIFHLAGHGATEGEGGHGEAASEGGDHEQPLRDSPATPGGAGEMTVDPGELKTPGENNPNLLPEWEYKNNKWAMTIDTQSCIGCNACVIACQSENNIPVVGKDQVLIHREMHWIRIDTYFEGPVDDPASYFMPVPCMQCEKAPCEIVCPVGATVHSEEGLNDMVYNRCVGTRYCSNNCPYKVRRFNFLLYSDQSPLAQLRANPNVTVRSRGVMEKCTYCVQRIWHHRIEAEKQGNRPIRDGEILTACQQSCPTEAIVFGNMNDGNSQVVKLKTTKLDYGLLAGLNTRPRTSYLARVTNPNPELSEA